jgi:hypothetical protein
MAYPQPIDDHDWEYFFLPRFPFLDRAESRYTADFDVTYNCIAYTLGHTQDRWINPPRSLALLTAFYNHYGYETCTQAESTIDGWMRPGYARPTHASVLVNGRWESKLGDLWRINHDRYGIRSENGTPSTSQYGNVVVYYRRRHAIVASPVSVAVQQGADVEPDDPEVLFFRSHPDFNKVVYTLDTDFKQSKDNFEQNYSAWKKTWFEGKNKGSQDSSDRANGAEWDALVKMTALILPYVVEKLKDVKEVFAVELYNTLQTDPKQKVDPNDIVNFYDLNNQAKQILKLYISKTVIPFDARVAEWEAHQKKVAGSSISDDFLDHDSYRSLVSMGKDITPLVMAKYSLDRTGWWYELLTEIQTGKQFDALSVNKREEYVKWEKWFGSSAAPAA